MIFRRFLWRICLILSLFVLLVWGLYVYRDPSARSFKLPFEKPSFGKGPSGHGKSPSKSSPPPGSHGGGGHHKPSQPAHPIDRLLRDADKEFDDLRSRQTKDVRGAAAAYRRKRGRQPPPGFDKWVAYAKEKDAILIEDMFDQIHIDLEPFWALDPKTLAKSVAGLEYVVSIRNGSMHTTESHDGHVGIGEWIEMLDELKDYLPDTDIGFNVFEEPRLLVPWENIDGYMQTAKTKGRLAKNGSFPLIQEFRALDDYEGQYYDHHWMNSGNYWILARDTCPPKTPARRAEAISDFMQPPDFPSKWPHGSREGYVANWTMAKDPCTHPHLRGLHGTFVEPKRMKTSKDLFPVFGGSKLPMNNDILLPPPEYWIEADTDDSGEKHWWEVFGANSENWDKKGEKAYWRGPATGGINKRETWTRFHRHRLLSMMNATQVGAAQDGNYPPQNFPLPKQSRPYEYKEAQDSSLSEWLESFMNGAFTDLMCNEQYGNDTSCAYNRNYYKLVEDEGKWKQFGYKYLPDVDGDALSTRYLGLLRSLSVPIKATIFNEWHDSRLVAWKHFVPMDNTFVDFWGIMDYFLAGRDEKAKTIAEEGQKWAMTVLRREDMLVYIYRLVLEYARIMDDRREKMGFVGDLRSNMFVN